MDSNELEPPSSDVVVHHQPSESVPQAEEGEGNPIPEPDIEPDDEDPLERDQFEIEK
ncbi:hypothetical protein ISN45_Aa04g011800, partial [Arabidopsis thaliana x Arabidopsis arenosa]